MGLDSVELILAIEDKFQIHIPDEEVSRIATVGELHRLILSKLESSRSNPCLTSIAFYRTRRGFIDTFGMARRTIQPSTALEQLLPRQDRRAVWRRLQNSMALTVPSLTYSPWIIGAFLIGGATLVTICGVGLGLRGFRIPLLVLGGFLSGAFLLRIATPLATAFPAGAKTVGDLARRVLSVNSQKLAKEVGGWNEREVFDVLCLTIHEQVGVPREKILPEARLTNDLV